MVVRPSRASRRLRPRARHAPAALVSVLAAAALHAAAAAAHAGAPTTPACVAGVPDASAQLDGTVTVSPIRGQRTPPPDADQLSGRPPGALADVVTG